MAAKLRLLTAAALSLAVLAATPAYSQNAPQGNPAPGSSDQGTPPANPSTISVTDFMSNPGGLLTKYPLGGGSMVADVRGLVQADIQTISALLGLVATANTEQKNAIGTGLGLAALDLVRTNPQAGTTIQNALVSLNDPTLLSAYAAVTGNQRLAAAGPGGGGGSPGGGESATSGGGISGGIGSPSALFANFGTDNTADAFTFPALTGSTPGTPTTPVGLSVSPSSP
jgi:hypothetical protein